MLWLNAQMVLPLFNLTSQVMSKENFEAKAAEIELITNFGVPAIPVDTMLQESENLFI